MNCQTCKGTGKIMKEFIIKHIDETHVAIKEVPAGMDYQEFIKQENISLPCICLKGKDSDTAESIGKKVTIIALKGVV